MNLEELTILSQQTAQRLEQITGEKATFALYIQQAQESLTHLAQWESQCHQAQQKIEASFNRQAEIERLEQERTALAAHLSQITGEVAGINAQLSSVQTQLAQFSPGPVSAGTGTGTGTAAINPVPGLVATTIAGTETSGVMQSTYPAVTSYQPQPTFTPPPPPSVSVILQPAAPIQPLPEPDPLQPQPQPQPQTVNEVTQAGGDIEALEGFEAEVNQAETRPQQGLPTLQLELELENVAPQPQPQPQLPLTTPVPAPEPPSPLALPAITFEPTVNAVSKNGHHAPTAPT